jgi:hypothetical protein
MLARRQHNEIFSFNFHVRLLSSPFPISLSSIYTFPGHCLSTYLSLARSVRKCFEPGDHAEVTAGQNADETGLVTSISDNVVTFVSDTSMQEVRQILFLVRCIDTYHCQTI